MENKKEIFTSTVFIALMITIVMGYFIVNDSKTQSIKNGENIASLNKTVEFMNQTNLQFIEGLKSLESLSSQQINQTLQAFAIIFQQQLSNENNTIGNITDHRIIANMSYENSSAGFKKNYEFLKALNATMLNEFDSIKDAVNKVKNDSSLKEKQNPNTNAGKK